MARDSPQLIALIADAADAVGVGADGVLRIGGVANLGDKAVAVIVDQIADDVAPLFR